GTTPYEIKDSTSSSDLLANLPLILGRVSAYAFLDAYLMVFSNFLFFLFSLYLKTRASRSRPETGTGTASDFPKLSDTSPMAPVWSGTTPTSIDEEDTWKKRIRKLTLWLRDCAAWGWGNPYHRWGTHPQRALDSGPARTRPCSAPARPRRQNTVCSHRSQRPSVRRRVDPDPDTDPRRGLVLARFGLLALLRLVAGVGKEEPGGGLGLLLGEVLGGGLGCGGGCGVVEGGKREALVAAGEGVGGVDVAVAGGAEGGGVGLAGDGGGGLLADLADPDARVAGRELVGGVDVGVAGEAEEGGVGAAEHGGRRRLARVADLRRQAPCFATH
ncbi:arginine/serine-rich zinc knuckle-containing protein 33, partial [Striga asiatica]